MTVSQTARRDVAEESDIGIFTLRATDELNAAEQQHIVDCRDQPFPFGDPDILIWHQHGAVFSTDTGKRFVEHPLPLWQANDRLQNQIDAILFQSISDYFQNRYTIKPAV
jgi:hypothetical protein